ncbi:MAG: hypothetical protein ACK5H1_06705 [Tenacibaculum sp.]
MSDKLETFFKQNNFDVFEPPLGHAKRFKKMIKGQKKSLLPLQLTGIAASVILILSFYFGNTQQTIKQEFSLSKFGGEMAETENFFITTIKQELKEIEKYRSIETETLIEDALDELEKLEEQYKLFISELSKNNNKKLIIKNIIANYQQRITVLENLLNKLESLKNSAKYQIYNHETI